MKRREVRSRLPALTGETLPVVVRHPDVNAANRISVAHRVDDEIHPSVGRRDVQQCEVVSVGGASSRRRHGVHAKLHVAGPVPFDAIRPDRIRAVDAVKHQRAEPLLHELATGVGPRREMRRPAVGIGLHRNVRSAGPIELPCDGVVSMTDPRPRLLKRIREHPRGRPIDDVVEIHPNLHRRGRHDLPCFEVLDMPEAVATVPLDRSLRPETGRSPQRPHCLIDRRPQPVIRP